MPSFTWRHGSFSWGPRLAALWFGLGAGPLAWAALLEINYVLSYVACEQRQTWMLHLATACALLTVGLGALAAWSAAPPLRGRTSSTTEARARFMALGGLVMCAWFALVILATAIPVLLIHPCTS
jgi:hypothetical protein